MELTVYNIKGEETAKKVVLDDAIFGITPNDHAIYLDAKQYMANQRQGTHCSKPRNAVAGSTRKLKRQKGTGTARMGDIKSPLLRGGGRVFGPEPRDYRFKLNKKVKRLARKSALSYKVMANNLMVIENFDFATPKTKEFVEVLNNFKLGDKKTLFVLGDSKKNVYLSARNLSRIKTLNASELNTYEILNNNMVFLAESSIGEIEKMFA